MGIVNKIKRNDYTDKEINIGQYTYIIRCKMINHNIRKIPYYYAEVKINAEHVRVYGFNPNKLPVPKINGIRVTKFEGLFENLGYAHLVKFNNSLYDGGINIYNLIKGLRCDIFDIRGSNESICNEFFYGYHDTCRVLIMDLITFSKESKKNKDEFKRLINTRHLWSDSEEKLNKINSILNNFNEQYISRSGRKLYNNTLELVSLDYIETRLKKMDLLGIDIRAIMIV